MNYWWSQRFGAIVKWVDLISNIAPPKQHPRSLFPVTAIRSRSNGTSEAHVAIKQGQFRRALHQSIKGLTACEVHFPSCKLLLHGICSFCKSIQQMSQQLVEPFKVFARPAFCIRHVHAGYYVVEGLVGVT